MEVGGKKLQYTTIRKHVNNLWLLGGEMIRDLHETPALRKVPVETLVFNMIQDGGPILDHNDSGGAAAVVGIHLPEVPQIL